SLFIVLDFFSTIFFIGLDSDSLTIFLFVSIFNILTNILVSSLFGAMFFLLLFFAAISSAIGYLEPIVTTVSELFKIKRTKAVIYSLLAIFIVGFPNILAHGIWSHILIGGRNLFDFA